MKTKSLLTNLTIAALAISSAQAAIISIADVTAVPDGTTTTFGQNFDVETLNGGTRILANNGAVATDVEVAYLVTTFNFGTSTSADIGIGFDHTFSVPDLDPSRMGVEAQDGGNITWFGGVSENTSYGSSLAGQSLTLILKYDLNEPLRGTSTSTVGSFWVDPTLSSTEGSPDVVSSPWNSNDFPELILYIDNESTPNTAGTSSITNTWLLTGTDATFANALATAVVPEPSSALLAGLAGVGLLLRRRRN